jgi:hypothetical protein
MIFHALSTPLFSRYAYLEPNPPAKAGIGDMVIAFVATFWLGLLVGVSFLATSVKFQSHLLNLPTALDVGRVTFALFSKIEWALCALLVVAALISRPCFSRWLCLAVITLALLLQNFWLLPVLDERAGQIIAGINVPTTNHHLFYAAADSLKGLLLLFLSIGTLWRLAISRRQS